MKIYRLSVLILSLFIVYSCVEENSDIIEIGDYQTVVQFTSEISEISEIQPRSFNSTWEESDEIGVFMKSTGATLADPAIVNGAYN